MGTNSCAFHCRLSHLDWCHCGERIMDPRMSCGRPVSNDSNRRQSESWIELKNDIRSPEYNPKQVPNHTPLKQKEVPISMALYKLRKSFPNIVPRQSTSLSETTNIEDIPRGRNTEHRHSRSHLRSSIITTRPRRRRTRSPRPGIPFPILSPPSP